MTGPVFDNRLLLAICRGLPLWLIFLHLAVVASALAVTWVGHLNRQQLQARQAEMVKKYRLEEEWNQLLLQHSTMVAHSRVEQLARDRLALRFPDSSQVVVVSP